MAPGRIEPIGGPVSEADLERLGCGSITSYPQLVAIINNGVKAREKLVSDVGNLAKDVDGLLNFKHTSSGRPHIFASELPVHDNTNSSPSGRLPRSVQANACLCGGAPRWRGDQSKLQGCECQDLKQMARLWKSAEPLKSDADPKAQRESVLRMAQPRKPAVAPDATDSPLSRAAPSKVDRERLERMSQPHRPRVLDLHDEPATRYGQPDPSRLQLMALPRAQRRLLVLEDQLDQEKASSSSPSSPRNRPSAMRCQIIDDDDESLQPRPVRSVAQQQKYVESRLYQKPASRAGSIAGLQEKLDALKRERRMREEAQRQAMVSNAIQKKSHSCAELCAP